MGELLRSAISALPSVATHPLAFVAYIVVVLSWLIIAWRVKRNKNLLQNWEKLPKRDRLEAYKIEIGYIPLKQGLSPEEYLKSRIQLYYLLAFAITCLMTVMIFVVSSMIGQKPANRPARSRPNLNIRVHQTRTFFSPESNATRVLLDVEISNSGELTTTNCWRVDYVGPHSKELAAIEIASNDERMYVPITRREGTGAPALELDLTNSINLTTATNPITRGVPVRGRMLIVIPGDRSAEFLSGRGRIKISLKDYRKNIFCTEEFEAIDEDISLFAQPTDKTVPMPKIKQRTQNIPAFTRLPDKKC